MENWSFWTSIIQRVLSSLSVCLSVCSSVSSAFSVRNGSFFCFLDNWDISRLTEPLFPRKFIFVQIWAKEVQNGPKIGFFGFCEKFCHKCNVSRKKWMMKFIFGMQMTIELFYKLILSFWVCIARQAQSTQNTQSKKFVYLINFSRKTWGRSWFFTCK